MKSAARIGRPPLPPELKLEREKARNKIKSKRANARKKAMRAARAIAEGRLPGKPGGVPKFTEEERIERKKILGDAWRKRNLEKRRDYEAWWQRNRRAQRAIAQGREPGRIGRVAQLTPKQRREKSRKNSRAYWVKNPDKRPVLSRKYYVENKDAVLANCRNRRARKRKAGGRHTAADIAQLRALQKGKCAFCLQPLGKQTPHVDHYVPLALGGSNDKANLRLLHPKCNLSKGALHPSEHARRSGLLCW